jgi:hypothetical protein
MLLQVLVYWIVGYATVESAFHEFSRGNQTQNGGCSIVAHPNITWIWEIPNKDQRTNSFYELVPLEESEYRTIPEYPEPYDYEMSQSFLESRWQPYEVEIFYRPFPQFKKDYKLYFSQTRSRYKFLDNLYNVTITREPRSMAIFRNVYHTEKGLIVSQRTCEWVRNGGCVYMFQQTDFETPNNLPHYEKAISLATGAVGTWHFPMEVFIALAGVPQSILNDEKVVFQLPRINSYIASWMALLNIPQSRLKADRVANVTTLFVPQMGRCIEMYETQMEWLQKSFSPQTYKKPSFVREILYVRRSGSRRVPNQDQAITLMNQFAAAHNFTVTVHDDRKLPSLQGQIDIFTRVPIVIAPHGAGLLFTVFSPVNACIMEFMPGIGPECYSRIAYLRRFSYHMYILDSKSNFKFEDLEDGLMKCHKHFERKFHAEEKRKKMEVQKSKNKKLKEKKLLEKALSGNRTKGAGKSKKFFGLF